MSLSVVMIGAGNVAVHLSKHFAGCGFKILQVFSRTESSAAELALLTNSAWTTSAGKILPDADLYFIALKDSVVDEFLRKSDLKDKLLVHCSGSLSLDCLTKYSSDAGVFYPLQSFSKAREVDFSNIPVFIESSSERVLQLLKDMAGRLTSRVYLADSHQRLVLHISAVFACNFVNHFYTIAAHLLEDNQLSFDYLRPLMQETLDKTLTLSPFQAQTGPALRFDTNILEKHMAALSEDPAVQKIYALISEHIYKLHPK
jgi:predicted short-subunit dehydrogenase-like oxidoreductase (DUF2520 family)